MRIKNSFQRAEIHGLSKKVHKLIHSESELTNRKLKKIEKWLERRALFIAFIKDEVIGCVAKDKIDGNFYEITSWFVEKRYRGRGIGKRLLQEAIKEKNMNYVISTFQKKAVKKITKLGFKKTYFSDLPLKIAVRYVMKKNVSSILKHVLKSRSSLMIYHADK